jgi:hypothetical protein
MKHTDIKVHQIYFEARQREFLASEFTPYLNETKDAFYESGVFRREFAKKAHLSQKYTGFVSWKFEKKSFVTAGEFLQLQSENPGLDLYFVNPFPELIGKFKNVWVQGAESHPGLLMLAQRIFDHAGIKVKLLDIQNTKNDLIYCNYWYSSQRFWQEYMAFCEPFYALFEDKNSEFYDEIRASAKYHGGGTLIPFFMERLISTFLYLRPDITRSGYEWTPERIMTSFEKMRGQLNLSEAKLDEIRKAEERLPKLKRWLLK